MEQLERSLNKDEKLLWSGKAEPFKTLDATNKKAFIRKAVISGAVALALIIVYAILARGDVEFKPAVPVVVLLLACISPLRVVTGASKLKKLTYAATDKRLLVVENEVRDMSYKRIKSAAFKQDEDGHTSLLCGEKALSANSGKWRDIALLEDPGDEGHGECQRFGFYAIDDVEGLKKVLKEYLPCMK